MSRHRYRTQHQGRPVMIDMGWDRPLQGYFMMVVRADAADSEDMFLFDNLAQTVSHPATLQPFLEQLERMSITVPEEMIEEVDRDGRENCGNKYVEHAYANGGYLRIPVHSGF